METSVQVYHTDDVPKSVKGFLKSQLSMNVIKLNDKCNGYQYTAAFKREVSKYMSVEGHTKKDLKKVDAFCDDAENILPEQWGYLTNPSFDNFNVYYIVANLLFPQESGDDKDVVPYGGIFMFHRMGTNYVVIQGISKFWVPGVVSLFDPKYPKLNSLLIPAIEEHAKTLGVNEIFVTPYPNQGRLLQMHYGFHKTPERKHMTSTVQMSCHPVYVKYLDGVEPMTPKLRKIKDGFDLVMKCVDKAIACVDMEKQREMCEKLNKFTESFAYHSLFRYDTDLGLGIEARLRTMDTYRKLEAEIEEDKPINKFKKAMKAFLSEDTASSKWDSV